jgi:hypothetical protein
MPMTIYMVWITLKGLGTQFDSLYLSEANANTRANYLRGEYGWPKMVGTEVDVSPVETSDPEGSVTTPVTG